MRASEPGQHLHLVLMFLSTYSDCVGLLMCTALSWSGTQADEMTEGKLAVKFASQWTALIRSFATALFILFNGRKSGKAVSWCSTELRVPCMIQNTQDDKLLSIFCRIWLKLNRLNSENLEIIAFNDQITQSQWNIFYSNIRKSTLDCRFS